jgi:hypothetical protein
MESNFFSLKKTFLEQVSEKWYLNEDWRINSIYPITEWGKNIMKKRKSIYSQNCEGVKLQFILERTPSNLLSLSTRSTRGEIKPCSKNPGVLPSVFLCPPKSTQHMTKIWVSVFLPRGTAFLTLDSWKLRNLESSLWWSDGNGIDIRWQKALPRVLKTFVREGAAHFYHIVWTRAKPDNTCNFSWQECGGR